MARNKTRNDYTDTPEAQDEGRETGKVANDHNKQGEETPTQKNEGRRTPQSRSDRESHVGSGNQNQSRRGNSHSQR